MSTIPSALFISTFSLLNFSFSVLCALFIIPLYSFIVPTRNMVGAIFQLCYLALISPVTLLLLASYWLDTSILSLVATFVQQYKDFSTLTLPFLFLVYLPLNLISVKLVLMGVK